jgi:phospholipid/cholesterol/gamma-HCH transport system substrate-binding protein
MMKAFTERRPKMIGAIAIAVMAVIVAAVLFLNRSVFQSGYQISARFPDAAGIAKGTDVLLAGVKVGTVDAVDVKGNAVDATMTIDNGVVLPRHTAADIQVETLLGVVDVTLDPVSGWARPLHGGAFLTDTSIPTEFYQLNNIAGHLMERSNAKAFNALVEQLANITKGKEQQVGQIIEGLGKLLTTVSNRSAQVGQLIDSSNTVAATLAQHDQQLSSAIGALDTVAAGLASHSTELASLIDNLDAMAAQTNGLLSENRPQIDALITHLTTTLGVVSHHQDDLAQAVSYLGAAIKGFASIGQSGATPLTWSNIYTSTTGLTGTAGVLGACGGFTAALDDALGSTPLPCATRTGAPSTLGLPSTTSGTGVPGSGSASPGGAPSLGTFGLTPSASPNSGLGGLDQLFAPLMGVGG